MGARGSTATCYGLTGVLNALWGATLPATDARLDLGPGRLGALLMALAVGALVAMPLAGRLADHWTGHHLLRWSMPLASASLALTALAPTATALTLAAVLFGVLSGALNVALSLQAVAVERLTNRPLMATLHGTWTLGAVLGGALVTAALHLGLDPQTLLLSGSAALAATTLALGRHLPPPPTKSGKRAGARPEDATAAGGAGGRGREVGLVVGLGVVGAAAFAY